MYEYETFWLPKANVLDIQEMLNELGKKGWHVVANYELFRGMNPPDMVFIMERVKQ